MPTKQTNNETNPMLHAQLNTTDSIIFTCPWTFLLPVVIVVDIVVVVAVVVVVVVVVVRCRRHRRNHHHHPFVIFETC